MYVHPEKWLKSPPELRKFTIHGCACALGHRYRSVDGGFTPRKTGIPHYSSHIWLWPSGKIMDSLRILMMASSYPILLQLCCGLPTLVKLPLLLSFGICKWLSSRLRSRLVHCVVACLVRGGKAEQWMLKPLGVWMFSQP